MYSSEDLEIKCKSNTMKLSSFVEMQCKDTRKQIVEVKVDFSIINNSENMAADEKDRFIQYLVDKVNTYELDKRATELVVEEFQSTFDSVNASLESLKKEIEEIKAELREERMKRKKAEAKAMKLKQRLKDVKIIDNQ